MSPEVDEIYYTELKKLDPPDVCRRALCQYDANKKCYMIDIFNDTCLVFPEERKIEFTNTEEPISKNAALFVLYYLINVQDTPIEKNWISEKDLPGGVQFFTGPHAIPLDLITDNYKNEINVLGKRCMELHGEVLDMADVSFAFRITRKFPLALLYWKGDDEFPPNAKILFDSSIKNQFPLDIVFVITVDFCKKIINQM